MEIENRYTLNLDLKRDDDIDKMVTVGTAISNKTRLLILKELQSKPYIKPITEMSRKLKIPMTTLLFHLDKLEKAGFIKIYYRNSTTGTIRVVDRNIRNVNLNVFYWEDEKKENVNRELQELRVGNYVSYKGSELSFATIDSVFNFKTHHYYTPAHYDAELVYATDGIITYYFSNAVAIDNDVIELNLSLEICSEAPLYNNDYLSDITFWINDIEVGTYLSKGDYGGRRGNLNPKWWPDLNTQFGQLITVKINENGVFINEKLINQKVNIRNIKLNQNDKIILSIGNKNTALHVGGFNIFGSKFGDYPQDIRLELVYKE